MFNISFNFVLFSQWKPCRQFDISTNIDKKEKPTNKFSFRRVKNFSQSVRFDSILNAWFIIVVVLKTNKKKTEGKPKDSLKSICYFSFRFCYDQLLLLITHKNSKFHSVVHMHINHYWSRITWTLNASSSWNGQF